jgi:predicted O-methyltransferase YrrM
MTHQRTYTVAQLAEHVRGSVRGDASLLITGVQTLDGASHADVTFLAKASYAAALTSTSAGCVVLREADAEHAFKANQFISKHPKYAQIKLHTGQALSVIPELNLRPNLAFIDADKVNYPAYLEMLLPMMQSGGLMLFDNTLWSGRVLSEHDRLHDADTKNMHAFNEKVNNLPNVQVLMMPIRDGLTAVLKS